MLHDLAPYILAWDHFWVATATPGKHAGAEGGLYVT